MSIGNGNTTPLREEADRPVAGIVIDDHDRADVGTPRPHDRLQANPGLQDIAEDRDHGCQPAVR
ncbi:MAG TPA: hypothetical protein DDZ81_24845 [Acetobacteraceae bacterium]|nr:hypothetical protein [Acetobacteraceae bacterium]